MGQDNYHVGLLGGSCPYPTVSPPSSLVSSVANSVNLEVRSEGWMFRARDLAHFFDLTTGSIKTSKVKKKGKNRPASDSSAATGQGGSSEAAMGTQSDDPPKKKTKKKKKIAEGDVNEVQTGLSKDMQGREVAIREGSGDGAA
ncbi:hypothetical protein F2Q69_00023776 [Brassica cretica]|uniref:Uncharacterized protein n=1 Tax=Brassica cretica TaxID=69181 RepID=A0A8S9QEQ7_BRACR|nr:hypothetical protein F2Q69_00023776 [Brassica cretica]